MWSEFLTDQTAYCREFMDFNDVIYPENISFAMDASGTLGFGGRCGTSWMQGAWGNLVNDLNPSIEYLELFALVAGVLAWMHKYANRKVVLYTDNKSVYFMVNKTSGGSKNCMVLIRKLVIHCLKFNVRVYARHLKSKQNAIADSISRFQHKRFLRLTRKLKMDKFPTPIPEEIWPFDKIWIK